MLYLLIILGFQPLNIDENLAAKTLFTELDSDLNQFEQQIPQEQIASFLSKFKELREIIRNKEQTSVNLTAPPIEIEAVNETLFLTPPILPPENKKNDSWHFRTVRFDVVPEYLYIYGLTIKPLKTIRIRSITFIFKDGSKTIHNQWQTQENGMGIEFPRKKRLPYLGIDEKRVPAKCLTAIEIEGSAQDGQQRAPLEFFITIPDPETEPNMQNTQRCDQLIKEWSQSTALKIEQVKTALADLAKNLKLTQE